MTEGELVCNTLFFECLKEMSVSSVVKMCLSRDVICLPCDARFMSVIMRPDVDVLIVLPIQLPCLITGAFLPYCTRLKLCYPHSECAYLYHARHRSSTNFVLLITRVVLSRV